MNQEGKKKSKVYVLRRYEKEKRTLQNLIDPTDVMIRKINREICPDAKEASNTLKRKFRVRVYLLLLHCIYYFFTLNKILCKGS